MATTIIEDVVSAAASTVGTSSLLNRAAELIRQREAADDKFFRSMLYYFELRIPDSVNRGGINAPFLFPLAVPPENYTMSEPFLISKEAGNRGGLFVEEHGIAARQITLSGQTGWKPRKLPVAIGNVTSGVPVPDHPSFMRSITREGSLLVALSGQRHFQLLQDTIFRTYADLKQDPNTSEGTELYFHSLRDDEHWRVMPENFRAVQSASSPLTFHYEIEMLAVVPTDATTHQFVSEDAELLDAMRDTYRSVRAAGADIQSVVLDLSELSGTIERDIRGWATILSSATSIMREVDRFLVNRADALSIPLAAVRSAFEFIDVTLGALDSAANLGAVTLSMPARARDIVVNGLRRMQDGYATLMAYPDIYVSTIAAQVEAFNDRVDLAAGAAAAAPATSAKALTTTPQSYGSRLLAANDLGLGKNTPRFTSAVERRIEQGDTLASLAARYLGDARQWKYIAVLNDLVPPYVTPMRRPRTVWLGDTVLIPSFARATKDRSSPVVMGAPITAPATDQLLGSDFLLRRVGGRRPGWVADPNAGMADAQRVSGVPNLIQGVSTRLHIDRGSCQLYTRLGLARVIGLGIKRIDLETAQFRLMQTVQEDPRIASVRRFNLTQTTEDGLVAEMYAEVRGLNRPEKIIIRI